MARSSANKNKSGQSTLKSSFSSTKPSARQSNVKATSKPVTTTTKSPKLAKKEEEKDDSVITLSSDAEEEDKGPKVKRQDKKSELNKSSTTVKSTKPQDLPKLDANSKKWDTSYNRVLRERGFNEPIHETPETNTKAHHILHNFDNSYKYGPCVGLTRLERWERANELGLDPPNDVKDILLTMQGQNDSSFSNPVFV